MWQVVTNILLIVLPSVAFGCFSNHDCRLGGRCIQLSELDNTDRVCVYYKIISNNFKCSYSGKNTTETIAHAIDNRCKLVFHYNGQRRLVDPYVLGELGIKRIKTLHAYQFGGGSSSGGIPEWRNFHVPKIEHLKESMIKFDSTSPTYRFPPKYFHSFDVIH